jgi:hypothetical protein
VADLAKILGLVESGALTPEEADRILAALSADTPARPPVTPAPTVDAGQAGGGARHLRIQVSDHGRAVVNLRIPINLAGFAADLVPGLSEPEAERIRQAIRSGVRGPLIDVGDEDGERVLIVSE